MNLKMNDIIPLNVILVLDDESRKKIKVNLSDLDIYKVYIIYDLEELDQDLLDKTHKVILLEDYIRNPENVSKLQLYKSIFYLDYIYLGKEELWLNFMKRYAKCYAMDITALDYERIYSVTMQDVGTLEKFELEDKELDNSTQKIAKKLIMDKKVKLEEKTLALDYLALEEMLKKALEQVKSGDKKLEEAQRDYLAKETLANKLFESHSKIIRKTRAHNRALAQYEPILTKDVYQKVSVSFYKARPIIIYLKEYEELIHLNSFLTTLYDAIKIQCKLSCKVLRLYDSSASKKVLTIPSYYKILKNKFTASDVLINDFVVKYGPYKTVLDLILTNKVHLDVLILVDCKDHNDLVTIGHDLTFNLCRNVKHVENFKLSSENTIVNNCINGSFMSWDTYEDYDVYEPDDRFLYLSSKPVIINILEALDVHRRAL